ncbi:extensin family protein [Tabrizicola sp.]|uniref:extensin-like domain-containing protein n=1 Tax=Tabrizicola sp. TaxID=2005166 RepID=UPI002623AD2A|nr:extensin family protein [Tabrizicola sp.]MDM7931372.1 extensin family protein [Tabrizicola sp.]
MRTGLAAVILCLASAAAAQQIDKSPRPLVNPLRGAVAAEPVATAPVSEPPVPIESGLARSLRPKPRPQALVQRLAALRAESAPAGLDLSSGQATRKVEIAAAVPEPTRREKRRKAREAATMDGAVCGVPTIKGEPIAPISSKVNGCGVQDAVRVISVAGVRLSQAATVDCSVATALNNWVSDVAQPAFGGNLSELRVAAHYVCRGRNNKKGAPVSEHGKGRAVDISAFVMTDGKVLTVQDNYNQTLRRIYKSACGIFKTTLGPGSDGYHEDHFHFDTSARKGGAYCR